MIDQKEKKTVYKKLAIFAVLFLGTLLCFDYVFTKHIIFAREYSNQVKFRRLLTQNDPNEIPIFGSSKARASFIPDSISPHAFNYGMEKTNYDVIEMLLDIEMNKKRNTPIIIEFNHHFFLHKPKHTINMSTYVPNLDLKVTRDFLEKHDRMDMQYRIPGFRYFGNYFMYLRYYFKKSAGNKKIISRGGNFVDLVPSKKIFSNLVNNWYRKNNDYKDLKKRYGNVEEVFSPGDEQRLKQLKEFLLFQNDTSRIRKFEAQLAKANDRPIYLVYTPTHKCERMGIENYEEMIALFDSWHRKFNNVHVINLIDMPLADKYFKNSTHLNLDGARLFCHELNKHLKLEK